MDELLKDRYLDLVKKTLSFAFWPEPTPTLDTFNYMRPIFKRLPIAVVTRLLKPFGLKLVRPRVIPAAQREDGRTWPGYAFTMIGNRRLDNLQYCVETAIREGIEGDLIETGVWRGGACILMRAILAAYGIRDRKVFAADSFAGLPPPDPEKHAADAGDQHYIHDYLAVSREEVESNFRKFGLLDEQVVFLQGWFKDTLPVAPIQRLAVMRLDGDMYGSTFDGLTNLYPKLSTGGFCIIDDYGLPGCRKAVDDFRGTLGIEAEMVSVDWSGRYWRKE